MLLYNCKQVSILSETHTIAHTTVAKVLILSETHTIAHTTVAKVSILSETHTIAHTTVALNYKQACIHTSLLRSLSLLLLLLTMLASMQPKLHMSSE